MTRWQGTFGVHRMLNWWRTQEGLEGIPFVTARSLRPVEAVAEWLAEHGVDPWRDCRPRKPDRPGEAA